MDETLTAEALTFLLRTVQDQHKQIALLTHIVTVLRVNATDEEEKKIDDFLRKQILQSQSGEKSDDTTTLQAAVLLRKLKK